MPCVSGLLFAYSANQGRFIEIIATDTGNITQFSYDALSRATKIEERTASSVTSTKQHLWCQKNRSEERDTSSALTKQFTSSGQLNFGIPNSTFFYTADHLRSVREMTKTQAGTTTVEAQYSYEPYGLATKITGGLDADFQYGGYYINGRSALNMPIYRAYGSTVGRFINRDPKKETAGLNLYEYAYNSPTRFIDALGLSCDQPGPTDDSDDDEEPYIEDYVPYIYNPDPISIAFLPSVSVDPPKKKFTSPFRDCEKGQNDPDCCRDNLVACISFSNKLKSMRLITPSQAAAIQSCCRGVNSKCAKATKNFSRNHWKDCVRRNAPNIILWDPLGDS